MSIRIVLAISIVGISIHQAKSQNLTDSINNIVTSMAKRSTLQFSRIGIDGGTSDLWAKYEQLKLLASNEQLIKNLSHESKVVRCYSFMALNERKDGHIFEILINNLKDNTIIGIQSFDVIRTHKVSDFYVYSVSLDNLTAIQKFKLDSTILFDETISLVYKNELLSKLPVKEEHYEIVKKYAILGIGDALVTLARFRNENDKEIILKAINSKGDKYSVFKAIREFPDSDFFKTLTRQFYKRWYRYHYNYAEFRMIYQALAQYPQKTKTCRIFNKTTHAWGRWKRDLFSTYVKLAIIKYPNKNYDYLLSKIKLSEFRESELKNYLEIDK